MTACAGPRARLGAKIGDALLDGVERAAVGAAEKTTRYGSRFDLVSTQNETETGAATRADQPLRKLRIHGSATGTDEKRSRHVLSICSRGI